MMAINRRERARIFARMFAPSSSASSSSPVPHRPPPDRGANVVVTVRRDDSRCARLQKALYLLGTYYNLFVIVDVSSSSSGSRGAGAADDSELRAFVGRVRSELLNEDRGPDDDDKNDSDAAGRGRRYRLDARVLPRHRIAFSNTSRGRVAFVRQLHGTELVMVIDRQWRRLYYGGARKSHHAELPPLRSQLQRPVLPT